MSEAGNIWRRQNLEKCAAAQRKWAAAHPEKQKERCRKQYQANKEKRLKLRKEYAEKNKDAIKSYFKIYRSTPNGKAIRSNSDHRRRARIYGTESRASAQEIKDLLANSTNCKYCNVRFGLAVKPTLDHMVPLSKGGPHSLGNLTAACGPCNSGKKDKMYFAGSVV